MPTPLTTLQGFYFYNLIPKRRRFGTDIKINIRLKRRRFGIVELKYRNPSSSHLILCCAVSPSSFSFLTSLKLSPIVTISNFVKLSHTIQKLLTSYIEWVNGNNRNINEVCDGDIYLSSKQIFSFLALKVSKLLQKREMVKSFFNSMIFFAPNFNRALNSIKKILKRRLIFIKERGRLFGSDTIVGSIALYHCFNVKDKS